MQLLRRFASRQPRFSQIIVASFIAGQGGSYYYSSRMDRYICQEFRMPPQFDHLLFRAETPEKPETIRKLFRGREKALEQVADILRKGMDLSGRRVRNQQRKEPWVIHGQTRSGKSHFARRIFLEFANQPGHHQVTVLAREKLDAIRVMRKLFEKVHEGFRDALQTITFDGLPDFLRTRVHNVTQIMRDVDYFGTGSDRITLSIGSSTFFDLKAGIDSASASNYMKLVATLGAGRTDSEQTTLSLRPPTSEDYAFYISLMVDILSQLDRGDHWLILVDDADLLENEFKNSPEARRERSELAEALIELSQCERVDVVVTSRSLYARSQKEFFELIDLSDHPMPESTLAGIQQAHLDHYRTDKGEEDGWNFLDEKALLEAARLADFLPGVFLNHMKTAFGRYSKEEDEGTRSLDWYLTVFRDRFQSWKRKYPTSANTLEQCIRGKSGEYRVSEEDPFWGTEFDNFFTIQSYFDYRIYQILPLALKVLQEPIGDQS
ncbi:MAG: hypothetical protein HQL56_17790 [Magnetococcales bacterium]|nr:hypothetical protein [Magnetococcales bacterium]